MRGSSVQMMMLTAPDVAATAAFYVDHLGFRVAARSADEVIVEGHGMQIVFSVGPGGRHVDAPSPDQAALEIPSTMPRIEALWDLDRTRDHSALGPMLDASGAFVYVTLDPARNAVALVTPLPGEADLQPERVTQRLRRPDFE